MTSLAARVESYSVVIAIGGVPVRVNTTDASFLDMLQNRYAGFVTDGGSAEFDFDVDLNAPAGIDREDVRVTQHAGRWSLERRDMSKSHSKAILWVLPPIDFPLSVSALSTLRGNWDRSSWRDAPGTGMGSMRQRG